MPKRAQDYEADNGFVEDAPQSKKRKGGGEKKHVSTEIHRDDEGNEYWEISPMRRVGISLYKGTTMVSIREYYEKDGKSLPGKKGISLSVEQYTALLEILPQVEEVLKSKGVSVRRPMFDGASAGTHDGGEGDVNGNGDDADGDVDAKPARSKLDKFKLKANHETTSDEEGG